MTEPTRLLVFQCTALNAKLSLKQCASNWEIANTAQPSGRLNSPKRHAAMECEKCAIGYEHFSTGKFQSGLRTTSLSPVTTNSTRPELPPAPVPVGISTPPPVVERAAPTPKPRHVSEPPAPMEIDPTKLEELFDRTKQLITKDVSASPGKRTAYSAATKASMNRLLLEAAKHGIGPSAVARRLGMSPGVVLNWGRETGAVPEKTRSVGRGKYSKLKPPTPAAAKPEAAAAPAQVMPAETLAPTPAPPPAQAARNIEYTFPLRRHYATKLVLPPDFNTQDAERLCAFLKALAWPLPEGQET